jgi:hypothetical protein
MSYRDRGLQSNPQHTGQQGIQYIESFALRRRSRPTFSGVSLARLPRVGGPGMDLSQSSRSRRVEQCSNAGCCAKMVSAEG